MAFSLGLPPPLPQQGWKVKIRDQERVEEPHVSVIRGKSVWRFGLRSERFLDAQPEPTEVPDEVVRAIRAEIDLLRHEWDAMYPENPTVSRREPADD